MNFIKWISAITAACALLIYTNGCTTTEEDAGMGGGAGAGAGALIGGLMGGWGGAGIGALAGGAIGAGTGALIGSQEEDKETEEQRATAEREKKMDEQDLKKDNANRNPDPIYHAYQVSPGKYMIYDTTTKTYWPGVYAIPKNAKEGDAVRINDKLVEVREGNK